ncbi:MAG: putative porin [Myxococcota bacterium]
MSHPAARAVSIALCATLLCLAHAARADDAQPPKPSDAAAGMLDAMREKGIISEEEYQDLYKRQAIYEMEQKEASALPGWLQDWTFGGDAAIRFDEINRGGQIHLNTPLFAGKDPVNLTDATASAKRDRFRFRLRLGAERKIGDDFLVGFRIATAQASSFGVDTSNFTGVNFSRRYNSDPRSAFVTAGDYNAPKGIGLDRIYIRWQPHQVEGLSIDLGKMENSFVSPNFSGDILVWDHDISPEGATIQYGLRLFDEHAWVKLRGSYFTVDEVPSATLQQTNVDGQPTFPPDVDEKDPFMYAAQLDFGGEVTPWLRAGARVSYYNLRDVNMRTSAATEDLGNGGAAISDNPLLASNFNSNPNFQTSGASRGQMREIVYDVFTQFTYWDGWSITPWFQLTHMFNAPSEDYGYDTGFDVLMPTKTKLTFMYASMPRNGTVALFTDSDFFDGYTNARGWGLSVEQAINRWTSLRGTYLSSTERSSSCQAFVSTGVDKLCDTSFWGSSATSPSALADFRRQVLDRDRILIDLLVKF